MTKRQNGEVLWRQRIGRRTMLRGFGVAAAVSWIGASAAGCGGSPAKESPISAGPSPTSPRPKRGGLAVYPMAAPMATLLPQLGSGAGYYTKENIYGHLFLYDYVNDRPELYLAQSIENPDRQTYVFKLRPGVRHANLPPVNGRLLDAEDVVASWDSFIANPRTPGKGVLTDYVESYKAPDPMTPVVKMKQPWAWAIGPHALGSLNATVVVPKELTEKDNLDKMAIGPGPYLLDEFDPAKVISFKRRPDAWYFPDRPYLDKRTHLVITDPVARAAAFKARMIDSLGARDKLEAEEFRTFGNDIVIEKDMDSSAEIWLNTHPDKGPFGDARMRRAIYAAIDIPGLIEQVNLGDGERTGPVPAYLPKWSLPLDELKKAFPHDSRQSQELLTAAGWDSRREIEIRYHTTYTTSALICEVAQSQFAAAGLRVKLAPMEGTSWQQQVQRDYNYQMVVLPRWTNIYEPHTHLRRHTTNQYEGAGKINPYNWSDADVDAIVQRIGTVFDAEEQKRLVLEAQRLLLQKSSPLINLYVPCTYGARWRYYHPGPDTGFAGARGHYHWIDVDDPGYPRDRR